MKVKVFFTKLTQWEHWPAIMIYAPIFPYYLWNALKQRSFTFFLHTNPSIRYSGDGMESKYETIKLIPERFRPKTILVNPHESVEEIISSIKKENIEYPVIAKPDAGFRGFLVKKLNGESELKLYFEKFGSIKIIIQEFISYKKEIGILYYRYPDENTGTISSITIKNFLHVKGDGKSTLSELILAGDRSFLYYDILRNIHQEKMNDIVPLDEVLQLTEIGNHSKGTQFLNGNHLISKELEKTFDGINSQIDGWYFGRLDIKYKDFDSLKRGENMKILEINGIISEPGHIYDPTIKNTSYFRALKTIKDHWKVLINISLQNRKALKLSDPRFLSYIKQIKEMRIYSWKLKRMNKKL